MTEQLTPAPEPEAPKRSGKSDYMVLYAAVPAVLEFTQDDRDDHDPPPPLRYVELGWQTAHDVEAAKRLAVEDVRARQERQPDDPPTNEPTAHPQHERFEKALRAEGVKLRAIPRRSWPDDVDTSRLYQPPPELQIR